MIQTRTNCGMRQSINFKAEKPFLLAPLIASSETIDGISFYIGQNGKYYEQVAFDKMFKVARGIVLPMYSK